MKRTPWRITSNEKRNRSKEPSRLSTPYGLSPIFSQTFSLSENQIPNSIFMNLNPIGNTITKSALKFLSTWESGSLQDCPISEVLRKFNIHVLPFRFLNVNIKMLGNIRFGNVVTNTSTNISRTFECHSGGEQHGHMLLGLASGTSSPKSQLALLITHD